MNNDKGRLVPLWSVLLACLVTGVQAADEGVELEVFKAADLVSAPNVRYPDSQRSVGNEGWVELNMMIDPNGKPYEVTVVDSTGNEAFEKAAIAAAEKSVFSPATRAGTPIHSGFDFKMTFFMSGPAKGAKPGFARAYKTLVEAIDAGDKATADAAFEKLEVMNLYEDAYKNMALYHYHRKWGTELEQLADLRSAVAGEKTPRYLPKGVFVEALAAMLVLEIQFQDYGNAVETWERLKPIAPKAHRDSLQRAMDEVLALQKNDSVVRLAGQITKGTWNGLLFKRRFFVSVTSGQVSEIKLRCQKQYLLFRHQPDVQYTVDARNGDCRIELVGDPGTKFDLVQS